MLSYTVRNQGPAEAHVGSGSTDSTFITHVKYSREVSKTMYCITCQWVWQHRNSVWYKLTEHGGDRVT